MLKYIQTKYCDFIFFSIFVEMETIATFPNIGESSFLKSPDQWLSHLTKFNEKFEDVSSSKKFPGFCEIFGSNVKKQFVLNVSRHLSYQHYKSDAIPEDYKWGYNIKTAALCSLRIIMRENKEIETLQSPECLKLFLDIA